MRKIYAFKALLVLFALVLGGVGNAVLAQNYFYVGTGTSTSSGSQMPFYTFYHDKRSAYIITAQELTALGATGNILGLAIDVASVGSPAMSGFTVKLDQTTASTVTSFPANPTVVYSSASHSPTVGWNNFAFTAPFAWDGVSNIIVEMCFDNTSYSTSSAVYYSTVQSQMAYGQYSDSWAGPGCSMTTGSTIWTTNQRPNMRLEFSPPNQNDAAITMLANPTFPTCAMDSVVKVNLANYGSANLTSATVNWSVNGVLQSPVSWTGNMAQFADTVVTVGTVAGGLQDADVLKVWSSQPNGVLDSNNVNDTLLTTLYNSLSGTYTINSAGTGDFISLTAAAAAADAYGICGATVFEIMDTLLTEQIAWGMYDGLSDSSDITIRSAAGVNAKVAYSATSASDAYVFDFSGASHYTVENLTLEGLGTGNSRVILTLGGSEDITINNCHIKGQTSTSTWAQQERLIYVNGADNHDWTITNNTVENGNYGLYLYGNFSNYGTGNVVMDNEFINNYYCGAYVYYQDDAKVNGNHVVSNSTAFTTYGINFSYVNGGELKNNYIEGTGQGNFPYYGIYSFNLSGDLSEFLPIHNNRVYAPGSGSGYGMYTSNGLFTEYAHNSVYYNGTASAEGIYITGGQYNNFINNIITVGGSGTAVWIGSGNPIYIMDNNNYSAPNGSIGYAGGTSHSTLADWTAATMYDSNSLSLASVWTDTTTLKVCGDSLYGMGRPMANNMYDFEGDMRQNPPCIGADEFMPMSMFGFSQEPVLCDGDTLILEQQYYDTVVWNNTDTAYTYAVTNAQTVTVNVYDGCGTAADTFNVNSQDYAVVNDENLCEGTSATLSTGIANAVYSWSNGSTDSTIMVDSAQTVWVEVVDANGCYSADTAIVTQSYDATLPDSTSFCEGSSVTLDPLVPGSFVWNDANNSTSATLNVSTPGNYCVTVTDQNCVSTACSDVAEILNPVASFNSASSYQTVQFFNTSSNTGSNTTYHWDFGDGNSSTDENPIHIYPWTNEDSVTVTVTLTVSNECGDFVYQGTARYGTAVSVNDVEIADMINLFPNPSNGTFNVAINAATSTDVNVEVLDVRGAQILVQNLGRVNGQMTQEINLEGAAAGIYFVKVNFNEQTAIYKLSVK